MYGLSTPLEKFSTKTFKRRLTYRTKKQAQNYQACIYWSEGKDLHDFFDSWKVQLRTSGTAYARNKLWKQMTQSLTNYSKPLNTNKNFFEPHIVYNVPWSGVLTAIYSAINFALDLMDV